MYKIIDIYAAMNYTVTMKKNGIEQLLHDKIFLFLNSANNV